MSQSSSNRSQRPTWRKPSSGTSIGINARKAGKLGKADNEVSSTFLQLTAKPRSAGIAASALNPRPPRSGHSWPQMYSIVCERLSAAKPSSLATAHWPCEAVGSRRCFDRARLDSRVHSVGRYTCVIPIRAASPKAHKRDELSDKWDRLETVLPSLSLEILDRCSSYSLREKLAPVAIRVVFIVRRLSKAEGLGGEHQGISQALSFCSPPSFPRPVDHHRQRRVRRCHDHFVDQKSLPIASYSIGRKGVQTSPDYEREERDRRTHIEVFAAFHRYRHQLPVSRVVEQLTSIPPPAWTAASIVRDLPLAAAPGEALHIDLIPARHIRDVGQPPPVGRERPRSFISFRLDHREGLRFAIPGHRQDPYILFRLRIGLAIDNEAPITRPVGESLRIIRLPQ